MLRHNLLSFSRDDLSQWLAQHEFNPVHAKTIFRCTYRQNSSTHARHDDLPLRLQSVLAEQFRVPEASLITEQLSVSDASVKFLYRLGDNAAIESVLIPESGRITLCISSQVGCAQACSFCHTGRMGLSRNLTAGEIVGQVVWSNRWLEAHPGWLAHHGYPPNLRITNVVFMGMGEPLDNTAEVIKAIRIMIDPYGLYLGPKKISVSTAGVGEGLEELIAARLGVSLAFSLHAPEAGLRSQLMKINRRYPLEQILALLQGNAEVTKRAFLVQYTLIAGVNDTPEMMSKLAALLVGLRVKVNLIPYNLVTGSSFSKPLLEDVLACYHQLTDAGIRCMIRFSKGQDIAAACGQLAIIAKKEVLYR